MWCRATGGSSKNPSYEQVSSGQTGHAEAVRISFEPKRISYEQLPDVFLTVAHNPTELNRQGLDVGCQYRSAILYGDASQKQAAIRVLAQLQRYHAYPRPLVTQVLALRGFHPVEAYHQNYLALIRQFLLSSATICQNWPNCDNGSRLSTGPCREDGLNKPGKCAS